ncbi:unnamed protein product, partial [Discosporangium mesarthrocarpum]
LLNSYRGYAQQAAMVNNWLHMASGGKGSKEANMMEHVTSLIQKHFDINKADALLSSSSIPDWLTTMQGHPAWRKVLIELAREHRKSTLLKFVLKQLNEKGFHNEMAAVISETDLFPVFNGKFGLWIIKGILVHVPGDDSNGISTHLKDLQRICCSTSFMFMYAQ